MKKEWTRRNPGAYVTCLVKLIDGSIIKAYQSRKRYWFISGGDGNAIDDKNIVGWKKVE
jgi:hypothetical protein